MHPFILSVSSPSRVLNLMNLLTMRPLLLSLFLAGIAHSSILDMVAGHARRADTAADCDQYTVKANDTCLTIVRNTNATYAQLISWNSDINSRCSLVNTQSQPAP